MHTQKLTVKIASPKLLCLLLLLIFSFFLPADAREKNDMVILKNGDQITCEVVSLARGMLTVKTDAMSTVQIKWQDIKQITSKFIFLVQDSQGQLYVGSLQQADEEGQLKVVGAQSASSINYLSVVDIREYRGNIWKRFSGAIDLGYTYAKARSQTQVNFSANLDYTTEHYKGQLDISTDLGRSNGEKNSERYVVALGGYRKLSRKWYAFSQVKYEHNLELQLDQRNTLLGGPGYTVRRTNHVQCTVLGGASYSREIYYGQDVVHNAEMVFLLDTQFFKLYSPKLDISTRFLLLPNLTTRSRVRSELNTNIRIEILKDFFLNFNFYDSFDNKPPSEDATKNDLGFTTGISWSFRR